jgi:hypothetical protein
LQSKFFRRAQKNVQNAFFFKKSVQKHSWRFFAFCDLWQNRSRSEGVSNEHAQKEKYKLTRQSGSREKKKMQDLEQKGTKGTKSKGVCVQTCLSLHVAAEVTLRSPRRQSIERKSNQSSRSTEVCLATSAATGSLSPALPFVEIWLGSPTAFVTC